MNGARGNWQGTDRARRPLESLVGRDNLSLGAQDPATFGRPDLIYVAIVALLPFAFLFPFWLSDKLDIGDLSSQHMAYWLYNAQQIRELHIPFWNSLLFAGFPYPASGTPAFFYPANLLFLFLPPRMSYFIVMVSPLSVAASFLFTYLRDLRVPRFVAIFAAIAASLSGGMITQLPHSGIGEVAGWWPAQIFLVHRFCASRQLKYFWLIALVVLLVILAGFPQAAVYSIILTICFGVIAAADPRHGATWVASAFCVALAVALGIALSAFLLIPMAELAGLSARANPDFEFFTQGSYAPLSILTMIQGWLFGGDGAPSGPVYWGPLQVWWEGVVFLGVLTLALAFVGVRFGLRTRRSQQMIFLCAVIFIFAIGNQTLIGRLLFLVPALHSFRLSERIVVFLPPAVAALSAFGLEKFTDRKMSGRLLFSSAFVGMVLFVASAIVLSELVRREDIELVLSRMPSLNTLPFRMEVLWPIGVLATGAGMLIAIRRNISNSLQSLLIVCLIIVLVVDLASFAWTFEWAEVGGRGYDSELRDDCIANLKPSSDVEHLARAGYVEPAAPFRGGDCSNNFFASQGVPTVNGYEPLVSSRLQDLMEARTSGKTLNLQAVYRHAPIVDLLGLKYLLAPTLQSQNESRADFSKVALGLNLLPLESLSFEANSNQTSRLLIVSYLANSEEAMQAQEVGKIQISTRPGEIITRVLRAGIDTAEWAWDRPDLQTNLGHQKAQVFNDFSSGRSDFKGHNYITTIELPNSLSIESIEFTNTSRRTWIVLEGVALQDNVNSPLQVLQVRDLLGSLPGYQRVGQSGYAWIFENNHALPRAWSPQQSIMASESQIRDALLLGNLPNGDNFDPARTMLVETGSQLASGEDIPASVKTIAYEGGRIELSVSAAATANVVVSESYYPGWRLQIDGKDAPLERVNFILIGFGVPPGLHRAVLWYEPRVYWLGLAISAGTLIAGGIATWVVLRLRRQSPIKPQSVTTKYVTP